MFFSKSEPVGYQTVFHVETLDRLPICVPGPLPGRLASGKKAWHTNAYLQQ